MLVPPNEVGDWNRINNSMARFNAGEEERNMTKVEFNDGMTKLRDYNKGYQDAYDRIKEIYDTTDYKRHIEEAKAETAKDCIAILSDWEEWEAAVELVKERYGVI